MSFLFRAFSLFRVKSFDSIMTAFYGSGSSWGMKLATLFEELAVAKTILPLWLINSPPFTGSGTDNKAAASMDFWSPQFSSIRREADCRLVGILELIELENFFFVHQVNVYRFKIAMMLLLKI